MLEILSTILGLLAVSDLIRFARVSKRMREMVYDDSRWVQRLRLMGCWNESEARSRAEKSRHKTLGALNPRFGEQTTHLSSVGSETQGHGNGTDKATNSTTIFDAVLDREQRVRPGQVQSSLWANERSDGFDATLLSPQKSLDFTQPKSSDKSEMLHVFNKVRSVRGAARTEYGTIYGALAPFYKDAIRSKAFTDAKIFRVYRDPGQQAQMLAQLSKFVKGDISQGWHEREEKFKDLLSAFESAVFREFKQGIESGDEEGKMRKYAHVLVTLNGGQKAIDQFISENSVIKRKADLGDPMDCILLASPIRISLAESHTFLSSVSTSFNAQIVVVDRVFPPSANVVIPFLRRVADEVIAGYLNLLFDELHQRSIESYLCAVSGIFEQSVQFARSLQPSQNIGDEFYEAVDELITKSFEAHVELYLKEELKFFTKKSASEVSNWERQLLDQDESMRSMYMSNVNRQADKRDFLSSFKKVVMMPVNVLPAFPKSSPFGGKPATAKALVNGDTLPPMRPTSSLSSSQPETPNIADGTTLTINRASTPITEPPTTELAAKAAIMNSRLEGIRSLFSLEVALNLVHAAKSSIERAAVFDSFSSHLDLDARKQCESIFISLLQILGTRHIKAGFDQAVEHLSRYNPRQIREHSQPGVAPLVMFLELVNVGDLIQQMVDVFYEQEMVATKLTDRDDFLDPAVKEKKRFEQMLDERVAAGLNKGIEVLMAEVEFMFATTQKPEDFDPDSASHTRNKIVDVGPSETAVHIVELVSSHTRMLVGSTDKTMLDVFNQEVGLRLFTALCKHLKRQRISVNGSIKLIRYLVYLRNARGIVSSD